MYKRPGQTELRLELLGIFKVGEFKSTGKSSIRSTFFSEVIEGSPRPPMCRKIFSNDILYTRRLKGLSLHTYKTHLCKFSIYRTRRSFIYKGSIKNCP